MADRAAEPWYPTAAYLYVLHLDSLALAWEYLRRHPDYRLDWLRHRRRSQAAQDAAHRWGLRLLEDPALDARDAHPAWQPGHAAVVQLYPDADPPVDAESFAFWRIPGHKQLLHDGKGLALERIYNKALAEGVMQADEPVTDEEIAALIFRSGLSTAEVVSTVSGRGVGMDAIKKFLQKYLGY